MRHIISMLMQNEAGALVRVAGMFSQRGFNIESLNVAPTDDDTVSRLTLVTSGDEGVVEQINRQLLKLVDVIDVLDMTRGEHCESELVLVKAADTAEHAGLAEWVATRGATVLDERAGVHTLRFIGSGLEVDAFVDELACTGQLREVTRSGAVALTPGEPGLLHRYPPPAD